MSEKYVQDETPLPLEQRLKEVNEEIEYTNNKIIELKKKINSTEIRSGVKILDYKEKLNKEDKISAAEKEISIENFENFKKISNKSLDDMKDDLKRKEAHLKFKKAQLYGLESMKKKGGKSKKRKIKHRKVSIKKKLTFLKK